MFFFFLFQANSEVKANFLSNYISLEQTRKKKLFQRLKIDVAL